MTVTHLRRLARERDHARAERDEAVAALRKAGVCPCSLTVLEDPGPTHPGDVSVGEPGLRRRADGGVVVTACPFKVYVAAPFADASLVREVHAQLHDIGIAPTSSWAMNAEGAENQAAYTPEQLRAFAGGNNADLAKSNAVLVLAREGAGGEMFAEVARAQVWGKAVFWVGRRTLSAWRHGVVRCENLGEALVVLRAVAAAAEGQTRS